MNFICTPCRNKGHEKCPGSAECYCQHRPGRTPAPSKEEGND